MDFALKEIGKFFLTSFPHTKCFYLLNGKFAIIDNNTNNFPKFIEVIEKRFKKPWKISNSELHLNIFIVDVDNDISLIL